MKKLKSRYKIMATLKTKPTKASVAKYFAAIKNVGRKKDCLAIAKRMEKITGEKAKMWGASIVGFGSYHYKYESGREGDWMIMGLSSRKDAISLYLMCDLDKVASLLKKLGKHKRGVGCLYIKSLEDIDLKVLDKLITKSLTIK